MSQTPNPGDRIREREEQQQNPSPTHAQQQQQNNNNSNNNTNTDETRNSYLYSAATKMSELTGSKAAPPLVTIALTGGPCAGKSTSLVAISTEVQKRTDFKVFCVPEAATLLVAGGLEWKDMNHERIIEYQLALLKTQLALEDNFRAVARACGHPALVLCDRGAMDGRSYVTPEQWDEICTRGSFSTASLRDLRYDAIVHLVTAAIGAEEHYNLDNPARFEDLEGARDADVRLRQMYVGHPRIKLIHNKPGESFQDKVNAAVDTVFQCIGHAPPVHDKRRFLLRWPEDRTVPTPHEIVNVTATLLAQSTASSYSVAMLRQTREVASRIYLVTSNDGAGDGIEFSLSKSSGNNNNDNDHNHSNNNNNNNNNNHTDAAADSSSSSASGSRVQQQMYLTDKEYSLLVEQAHPDHVPLVKRNYVFTIDGVFFDLAVHVSPSWSKGFATLYVDGLDKNGKLPDFLSDAVETTGLRDMTSFHMSVKVDGNEIAEKMNSLINGAAAMNKKD